MSEEEQYTLTQKLGSADYPTLLPGHKDGVRFLNKLYNEGLISPDFALDKDKKKMYQDIATGKVGFYSEDAGSSYGNQPPDTYGVLKKTVPGALLKPLDPYTNEEGKHTKPRYIPALLTSLFLRQARLLLKRFNIWTGWLKKMCLWPWFTVWKAKTTNWLTDCLCRSITKKR